jgi:hypothetical protein
MKQKKNKLFEGRKGKVKMMKEYLWGQISKLISFVVWNP